MCQRDLGQEVPCSHRVEEERTGPCVVRFIVMGRGPVFFPSSGSRFPVPGGLLVVIPDDTGRVLVRAFRRRFVRRGGNWNFQPLLLPSPDRLLQSVCLSLSFYIPLVVIAAVIG